MRETVIPYNKIISIVLIENLRLSASHFRSNKKFLIQMTLSELTYKLLTSAIAIYIGGINKNNALLNRGLKHCISILWCSFSPNRRQITTYLIQFPIQAPLNVMRVARA